MTAPQHGLLAVLKVKGDDSGATYTVKGIWSHGYLLWSSAGEGFSLSFKACDVLMERAAA
jgi:hypothetical protein